MSEVGKVQTPGSSSESAVLLSGSESDETRTVPAVSPKVESGTTGFRSADNTSNETESTETESGSGTWEQVADLVMTRNQGQCRSKWLFHLEWKERGGTKKWTQMDDLHLLEGLLFLVGYGGEDGEVEDEDCVDWAKLCEGWDSSRSGYFLRKKWACLRRTVPRYLFNSFQGKCDGKYMFICK